MCIWHLSSVFVCLSIVNKLFLIQKQGSVGFDRDKTKKERWCYGDPLFPDRSCISTSDPETCCWVEVTQRWREQKQPEGKGRGCTRRRSKRKRLSDRVFASSSVFRVVSCLPLLHRAFIPSEIRFVYFRRHSGYYGFIFKLSLAPGWICWHGFSLKALVFLVSQPIVLRKGVTHPGCPGSSRCRRAKQVGDI